MNKVVFLLIGEIKFDGRVQKEIKILMENGFEVELIINNFYNDKFNNYNFKIHAISTKKSKRSVPNTIGKFKFCRQAFEILKDIKPDVVHCNDLCTLYGGYLYKKYNKNSKLIYDAHELYPEMFSKKMLKEFWGFIEKKYIKKADYVISPEHNRAKYMESKYKLKNKIIILENLPLKSQFDVKKENIIEERFPCTSNKKKILYLGALIPNRSIENIIRAFKYLDENYNLFIIGKSLQKSYKDKLTEIISENGLSSKVYLLDPIPNREVIDYINSSDIGVVFYNNSNLNNYYCASNKIYEFLVCKKPIITNNYPGLVKLVEENGLGICLNEVTDNEIYKAIINLKQSNNNISIEKFFWEKNENKICYLYGNR